MKTWTKWTCSGCTYKWSFQWRYINLIPYQTISIIWPFQILSLSTHFVYIIFAWCNLIVSHHHYICKYGLINNISNRICRYVHDLSLHWLNTPGSQWWISYHQTKNTDFLQSYVLHSFKKEVTKVVCFFGKIWQYIIYVKQHQCDSHATNSRISKSCFKNVGNLKVHHEGTL